MGDPIPTVQLRGPWGGGKAMGWLLGHGVGGCRSGDITTVGPVDPWLSLSQPLSPHPYSLVSPFGDPSSTTLSHA